MIIISFVSWLTTHVHVLLSRPSRSCCDSAAGLWMSYVNRGVIRWLMCSKSVISKKPFWNKNNIIWPCRHNQVSLPQITKLSALLKDLPSRQVLSRPEYNIKVHLWSLFRLLLDAPDTRHLYNARNKSSWCKICPCLVQQRSECCSTPSMYLVIMKLQQSRSRCCSLWMAGERVIDDSIQVIYMTFIPFDSLSNHIFSKNILPLPNASS